MRLLGRTTLASLFVLLGACGSSTPRTETPADDCDRPWTSGPAPAGCDFVHEGCCYADQAEACRSCPENCTVLESYPARTECSPSARAIDPSLETSGSAADAPLVSDTETPATPPPEPPPPPARTTP